MVSQTRKSRAQSSSPQVAGLKWSTESIRLSVFSATHQEIEPALWRRLAGKPADEVIERPAQSLRQEFGAFAGGRLIVAQQPLRTDLILAANPPPPSSDPSQSPVIDIGPFDSALPDFLSVAEEYLASAPEMQRLAFGPVLVSPAANLSSAYSLISQFLPALKIDAESSRDLFYQINRPRISSAVRNLRINRLAKWQVVELQLFQIDPSVKAPASISSTPLLRLELDINTAAENTQPLKDQAKDLLSEMTQLAQEIATRGDIE